MRRSMDLAWTVIVLAWLILGILYWGFTTVMFAVAATIGFWILLQTFFWALLLLAMRRARRVA
jgi:hypothetical protein